MKNFMLTLECSDLSPFSVKLDLPDRDTTFDARRKVSQLRGMVSSLSVKVKSVLAV